MPVKVTSDELVDLLLRSRVEVLELMHGLELDDIQSIW